jgi:hypothetical protein
MTELTQLMKLLNDGGMIALLLIILVGGLRRWWVFGWIYEEKMQDCDEWKELALKGAETATRAAEVAVRSNVG